jgi:sugar lactone lactonase YvrE
MYIMDGFNKEVEEYTLSTAWDISTASFVQVFLVTSQDANATGITFKPDGTKMYIAGENTDTIYQYSTGSTLTTNTLDLSTGNAFQITPTSNIQVGLSNPAASGTVSQATLLLDGAVNGYDLSGAAYDSVSFSVSGQDTSPLDLTFNNDGTKMYIVGSANDRLYQYSLSTAYDLSTASYDSVSFSVSSQDTGPSDMIFNNDGTKMYIVGFINDSVYQYSLSTAYALNTASYDSVSLSLGAQDSFPAGVAFNNNGTKMYIVGGGNDAIYQYSLSTAFDLSTASYDSVSLSISGQDTNPRGIVFNSTGTKMYMVGIISLSVHQYSLSTAFDLSTASYDSVSFSVSSQDNTPSGMSFNTDGTKMYVVGFGNDSVYQYSTGSAYTVTYDSTIQFGGGTAPDSPLANETDVLTFSTRDGGTTYQAAQAIDGAV